MASLNNFRGKITKDYKVLNYQPLNIKSENGTPLYVLEVQFEEDVIEKSIVYDSKETSSNGVHYYNDARFFDSVEAFEFSLNLIDSSFGTIAKIVETSKHPSAELQDPFSREVEYIFLLNNKQCIQHKLKNLLY